MPKWLALLLLPVLLISPALASAEGGTKLEAINVELWSEYDQPSMLVIYEFLVSEETPLPAEVKLRFPNNANLVAVAVEHGGELFNKDFTRPVEQGNWQSITIKAESYEPHRIEYYQPLTQEGGRRQFRYQWFGDYSVSVFQVIVLVPADSTGLVTDPPLQETASAAGGRITAGSVTKNDLKMMHSFQFELEYQRSSSRLVEPARTSEPIVPAVPVDENTAGRVSITNLPWIIGAFGLALICVALFSYWRSTQSSESQPGQQRRKKPEEKREGQAYCHECGTRAHAGDRFCRICGSRLRME